jgi:hypothetical protein
MSKRVISSMMIGGILLCGLTLGGCEKKSEPAKAVDAAKQAASDGAKKVEEGAKGVQDAMKK